MHCIGDTNSIATGSSFAIIMADDDTVDGVVADDEDTTANDEPIFGISRYTEIEQLCIVASQLGLSASLLKRFLPIMTENDFTAQSLYDMSPQQWVDWCEIRTYGAMIAFRKAVEKLTTKTLPWTTNDAEVLKLFGVQLAVKHNKGVPRRKIRAPRKLRENSEPTEAEILLEQRLEHMQKELAVELGEKSKQLREKFAAKMDSLLQVHAQKAHQCEQELQKALARLVKQAATEASRVETRYRLARKNIDRLVSNTAHAAETGYCLTRKDIDLLQSSTAHSAAKFQTACGTRAKWGFQKPMPKRHSNADWEDAEAGGGTSAVVVQVRRVDTTYFLFCIVYPLFAFFHNHVTQRLARTFIQPRILDTSRRARLFSADSCPYLDQ
jgi:hypothetical protein